MAFVPLIGLSPFLLQFLSRKKYIFKIKFFVGIAIGSIPTFLNLYFSYQQFGSVGVTSLFDFAKKQAIGSIEFNEFIFIPFKYFYLTFN